MRLTATMTRNFFVNFTPRLQIRYLSSQEPLQFTKNTRKLMSWPTYMTSMFIELINPRDMKHLLSVQKLELLGDPKAVLSF